MTKPNKKWAEFGRDEIIGFLRFAADDLGRHKPGTVQQWISERLELFLSGDAKSLDAAFGLKKRPGAPTSTADRDLQIAIIMERFRQSPAAKKRGAIRAKQHDVAEHFKIRVGAKFEDRVKAIERIEHRYTRLAKLAVFHEKSDEAFEFRKRIYLKKSTK